MTGWLALAWGCFGGFGAEAVAFYSISHQHQDDFPYWVRSAPYWVGAGVMILIGGGVAAAHQMSGIDLQPLLAMEVGIAAPAILRRLSEGTGRGGEAIKPGERVD